MFELKLLPIDDELVQINEGEGKRFYQFRDGRIKYPSITSVLSHFSKDGIDSWKKRVGEEKAKKITDNAAFRGTAIHETLELFLQGKENEERSWKAPTIVNAISSFKSILKKHVTKIYGIEIPLYSHDLKVAGTCDLFCLYDGKLTVVDYKTSLKPKKDKYLTNYMLQGTAYCVMLSEMFKVNVESIKILIYDDVSQNVVEKKESAKKWRSTLDEYIQIWYDFNVVR